MLSVGLAILGTGPGTGVSGDGDLCTLRFEVLDEAATAGTTSIIPFNARVFSPGLQERPVVFPSLTLDIDI